MKGLGLSQRSIDRFWQVTIEMDLWRTAVGELARTEKVVRDDFKDLRREWRLSKLGEPGWEQEEW